MHIKVKCKNCGEIALIPMPDFVVEDLEILHGECPHCNYEVYIDCIVNAKEKE